MADSQTAPVFIFPDLPVIISNGDDSHRGDLADFGFSAYIDTIAGLIANKKNKTPLVIGVYGKWGSGKTTLMQSIADELKGNEKYKAEPYRTCRPVWFQAWKYKEEDEILAALLEQIFNTMAQEDFFTRCRGKIEEVISSLKPGKTLAELLKKVTAADVSGFFQEVGYRKKLGFYDEFEAFFKRLIWTYLSWRPQNNTFEAYDDAKGVLVIFIDDLDRCPKGRIVNVLETIKLFMDIPGCVFVIGADNEIIFRALEETYKENAERFMDKIVQVTFNLPRIPDNGFAPYLKSILKEAGLKEDKPLESFLPLLLPVLDNNPRNFKRFLNDLNLQKGLISHKALEVASQDLLFWNLIEKRFRPFYLALRRDGGHRDLAAVHKILDTAKEKEIALDAIETQGSEIPIPDSVAGFIKDRRLIELVDRFRPGKEGLERLVTLTGIVEAPKKADNTGKTRADETNRRVLIPAGNFIYQEGEKRTFEYDYELHIYPVTNHQYERFIHAGGYQTRKFWSKEGWRWREKGNCENPDYWGRDDYNDPEQPVVGVSWYEAEAYARWLTGFKDDGHTYRLPKEEEWERAARGDQGNIYPWGNEFDKDRCNSKESSIGKPTRVNLYPNGISSYGCYDMAGNVWEWTSSKFDEISKWYAFRGGSFGTVADFCRCDSRSTYGPDYAGYTIGFRCARVKL